MKVYWYKYNSGKGNFGDELTPYLLDYLGIRHEWASPEHAQMFGIGSLMHFIPDDFEGIVWSTGMLTGTERKNISRARVLGFRGKLTMERVAFNDKKPIFLGDGGLLCDLFYKQVRKKYKLGIISHYVNALNPVASEIASQSHEIKIIDICAGVPEVIEQVSQCEHILSSSLHGLILSDSLGIPNEWYEFKENEKEIIGKGFKFNDYLSNFGITNKRPVVLKAQDTLETILPYFQGYDRPDINSVKENLRKSLKTLMADAGIYSERLIVNITSREDDLLSRLNSNSLRESAANEENKSSIIHEMDGLPLRESIHEIVEDLGKMEKVFLGCLGILGDLRKLRIVHRRISVDNIAIEKGIPRLINWGWGLDCGQMKTSDCDWQIYLDEDIMSMGKVFEQINNQRYPLIDRAIKIMLNPEDVLRISEIDVLKTIFSHVFQLMKSGPGQLSEVIGQLLNQINLREKALETLRTEISGLENRMYFASNDLLNLEIDRIIPAGEKIIFLDEGTLLGQINISCQSFPFTEKDGYYNGPPKDSTAAIDELKLQMRKGIRYIVIAWPAFWWLEHYKEWHQYLRKNFPSILENERLVVFDLRQK